MRGVYAFVIGLMVTGCTADSLIQTAYPDREIFRFRSMEGDLNSYACEAGPSEAETKARAGKAHQFFDKRLDAIAERFAERVMSGYDAGKGETAVQQEMKQLEAAAIKLSDETEQRYQCLFFDAKE
jgi:hypothetical protein